MKSILFIGLLALGACSPKLQTLTTTSAHFTIKEAYEQQEIPGQSDAMIRNFLKIDFNSTNTENLRIDSAYYKGKMYPVNGFRKDLKINISETAGNIQQNKNVAPNQALLYYTANDKAAQILIENITKKEALYLP